MGILWAHTGGHYRVYRVNLAEDDLVAKPVLNVSYTG